MSNAEFQAIEAKLKALMLEAQQGNAASYSMLLRLLGAHLRAYFRRRLGRDPDSVEDLIQETLLAVHNQRHTYQASEPFTPWAHAIAKYKLIDHLRRDARRAESPLPDADDAAELVEETLTEAAHARRDVAQLLKTLPPRFRLPIEHVKIEGLSVEETAARTGMSVSAVKVGIHRGLKALARGLRGGDDAD